MCSLDSLSMLSLLYVSAALTPRNSAMTFSKATALVYSLSKVAMEQDV
jgi:hypothetical protein